MNIETLISYILASAVIIAIPGPNNLLIVNDSISHGFNKSLMTLSGVVVGMGILFACSLVGITTLLMMFSWFFIVVKWLGIAYLIYLGITQIIASFRHEPPALQQRKNNKNFFMKGLLISVTNPKGLVFAGAFFPQFLNRELSLAPQFFTLCLIFLLLAAIIGGIHAYGAFAVSRLFKTSTFKKLANRISGTFLICFGIGLSFVKRSEG